jgi:hypothetical protein
LPFHEDMWFALRVGYVVPSTSDVTLLTPHTLSAVLSCATSEQASARPCPASTAT